MIAFTRFDAHPILERGVVTSPDLVVIADTSLLDDPLVRPLQGLASNGTVLMNTARPLETIAAATYDFTDLALSHTGSTAALSVALGVGAAKLAGLQETFIEEAVIRELQELKLDTLRLEKNLNLARACYAQVQPAPTATSAAPASSPNVRVIAPVYEGAWAGTASVASEPNTPLRKTGDWRVKRPVIDLERCTHCWICFVTCPDGAIALSTSDVLRSTMASVRAV